jgi:hypothetical protein
MEKSDDRLIAESLGLCWHESYLNKTKCIKCNSPKPGGGLSQMRPDFSKWEYFGLIMERGPDYLKDKKGTNLWSRFLRYLNRDLTFPAEAMEDITIPLEKNNPPVMSKELAEFLRGRKEE